MTDGPQNPPSAATGEQAAPPPGMHVVPGAADELRKSIEEVRRSLPLMAELAHEVAKARYASFQAHMDAGFSREEALDLCKSFTI